MVFKNIISHFKRNTTVPNTKDLGKSEKYIPKFQFARVSNVYDGDTITVSTLKRRLFKKNKIYSYKVRIDGIDCPEIRGSSDEEKFFAEKAKSFVVKRIDKKVIKLDILGYDKYGRILAHVFYKCNDNHNYGNVFEDLFGKCKDCPHSLAGELLKNGLAVIYNGETKREIDWKRLYEYKQSKLEL